MHGKAWRFGQMVTKQLTLISSFDRDLRLEASTTPDRLEQLWRSCAAPLFTHSLHARTH
jgi:hypothetical protein